MTDIVLTWKGGRDDTLCTSGDDMNFAVREMSADYQSIREVRH